MQKLRTMMMMRSAPVFNTLHTGSCSMPNRGCVRISLSCLVPAPGRVGFLNHSAGHSSVPRQSGTSCKQTGTSALSFPNMTLLAECRKSDLFSRYFSTSLFRMGSEQSDKGQIVYKGPISAMIRIVKIFSLSTSVIGLCLQPMIFSNPDIPVSALIALGGMINFLVFLNPFIIHHIAKRYVTELWWNKTTGVFTAVTWSLFVQPREWKFTADDVTVPYMSGLFTSVHAKGVPLFFDPQMFCDSEAYIHMMGFDKRIDWELPKDSTEKEQKGKT